MLTSEMIPGTRVEAISNIDCSPTTYIYKGQTGVVVALSGGFIDAYDLICGVKLDEHNPELADWDNVLHINEGNAGGYPEPKHFKKI